MLYTLGEGFSQSTPHIWVNKKAQSPSVAAATARASLSLWMPKRPKREPPQCRDCLAGAKFVASFPDEEGRHGDELAHEVSLTRPYFLGVMPVTQELWQAVMNNHPAYFDGHDRPIEQVSWVDALVFLCRVLCSAEPTRLRLAYCLPGTP